MKIFSLFLALLFPILSLADGKITNADIYSAAAIATTKLAAKTAHNACTFNGSGFIGNGVAPGTSANVLTSNGTDWTSAAVPAPTSGNLTDAGTDGIIVTNGGGAVLGSGTSFAQHVADATHNGYLLNTDWVAFNAKQAAGNYITALTGDGSAAGPGSAAFTLATVNGNVGSFTNGSFTVNAKGLITAAASGTAPVTSLTVATANGFAGSFSASVTPVLTLTTSVTGILSGNGTAISAASTTGSGSVVLATSPTITTPTIAKIANLTSNGFVTTTSGDGTLVVVASPLPVANTTVATQALSTCTTARTVDWSTGNAFTLTLTSGNACTLTFSNQVSGQTIVLWLTNGGSGGTATVVWPTAKWFPAGAPVMTTGTAALDVCTCTYNGTSTACNCLQNGG